MFEGLLFENKTVIVKITSKRGHGIEAEFYFIYHYRYFYQVTITPLKALLFIVPIMHFTLRPVYVLHTIV
jgi:hypothetical protein